MKNLLSLICLLILAGCSGSAGNKAADLDLSVLSSTVLSVEMSNITQTPGDYLGKTIRVRGSYSADQNGHYVITKKGDSCCPLEGFAFVYSGEYPEEQATIEVFGVFSSYEDNDRIRYYLAVDELSVKQ
jgi:hypothetical protein